MKLARLITMELVGAAIGIVPTLLSDSTGSALKNLVWVFVGGNVGLLSAAAINYLESDPEVVGEPV